MTTIKFLPMDGTLNDGRSSTVEVDGVDAGFIECEVSDLSSGAQRSGTRQVVSGYTLNLYAFDVTPTFDTLKEARDFTRAVFG